MPKTWLYYLALVFPLVFGMLVAHTPFVDWLWYSGHQDLYHQLNVVRVAPLFRELVGGWPLAFFIITVVCYWNMDDSDSDKGLQFLSLPLVYVPFAVIGTALVRWQVDTTLIYSYPVIVIIGGYLYVLPWIFCIWVFDKLRIVM